MGKSFWEDLEIDAIELSVESERKAKLLIDHWGITLTETDLLKLKAYSACSDTPIESAMAQYALDYYLLKDYHPDFIHQYKSSPKKTWVSRIFAPVVQLVRTHRS